MYFLDSVLCVKWNQSGDLLATASSDGTAKLIDFKSGKTVGAGITPDGSKFCCCAFA